MSNAPLRRAPDTRASTDMHAAHEPLAPLRTSRSPSSMAWPSWRAWTRRRGGRRGCRSPHDSGPLAVRDVETAQCNSLRFAPLHLALIRHPHLPLNALAPATRMQIIVAQGLAQGLVPLLKIRHPRLEPMAQTFHELRRKFPELQSGCERLASESIIFIAGRTKKVRFSRVSLPLPCQSAIHRRGIPQSPRAHPTQDRTQSTAGLLNLDEPRPRLPLSNQDRSPHSWKVSGPNSRQAGTEGRAPLQGLSPSAIGSCR